MRLGDRDFGHRAVPLDVIANRCRITNEHPEVSFRTLFLPVWYEGYGAPRWVWQTSGATSEPKLSIWPLLFGTLKATFFAMLISPDLLIKSVP